MTFRDAIQKQPYRCVQAAFLLLSTVLAASSPAKANTTYHVGNSLTWDAIGGLRLTSLAEAASSPIHHHYHIRCGRPLAYIFANPTDVCVPATLHGEWVLAFPTQSYDSVTFQPFSGASVIDEWTAFNELSQELRSNPNNRFTRVYLYQAFPPQASATAYMDAWTRDFPGPDAEFEYSRAVFDWMYQRWDSATIQRPYLIPLGEVLLKVDLMARAGAIPEISSAADLYRDALHLNNVGRYVASMTFLTVLSRLDPRELPVTNAFRPNPTVWPSDVAITQDMATALQEAVWSVVSNDPRTGIKTTIEVPALAGPLQFLILLSAVVLVINRCSTPTTASADTF